MDADIKSEITQTLRAARKTMSDAKYMFRTVHSFFRDDMQDGRPTVDSVARTLAEAIERGIEKGLKAQTQIRLDERQRARKTKAVRRPTGIESP